jgi:hypothetical protein
MNSRWKPLLAAVLTCFPVWAHADCRAQSPSHTVALIELYTSEGCDSCPPADRWLSQIDARGDAVVALSLHVDYWDRLGWKDRFANAALTARQYDEMQRQQTAFVYTPQVIVQGRDFRHWGVRGEPAASIAAINAGRRAQRSSSRPRRRATVPRWICACAYPTPATARMQRSSSRWFRTVWSATSRQAKIPGRAGA